MGSTPEAAQVREAMETESHLSLNLKCSYLAMAARGPAGSRIYSKRSFGTWGPDDYHVISDGLDIGRAHKRSCSITSGRASVRNRRDRESTQAVFKLLPGPFSAGP